MSRKLPAAFLFLVMSLLLGHLSLHAYEAIQVTNGGTLQGQVTFKGTPPKLEPLPVSKNQDHCGTSVPNETLKVGAQGGIENVLVTIEDIARGKALEPGTSKLDNNGCRFHPHVQAVPVNQTLEIVNSDPVLHNTHAFLGTSTVFNLALPLKDQKIAKRLKRPGLMTVKCDAHSWMSAYIVVLENPYYDVTDESGTFEIGDIPPGTYQVKAWHEKLGVETQKVTIEAGKVSKVAFSGLKP